MLAANKGDGTIFAHGITYISGTGVAGADGVASTLKTLVLPANVLARVGDRLRVRAYWTGDTGVAITGTTKLNGLQLAATVDTGAATFQINETYVHYIDATHGNILEGGNPPGASSGANVAGFDWANAQNITFEQNAAVNNRIILYALIVDIFPCGQAT